MTTQITIPDTNTVLQEIIFQCLLRVAALPDVKAADKQMEAAFDILRESPYKEVAGELYQNTMAHYHEFGEAMFMWGWTLRGNPEMLQEMTLES
jgi:hypothetical protein